MNNLLKSFIEVCPKNWTMSAGSKEQSVFCGAILDRYVYDSNILLIGTGHSIEQYYDWPNTLKACGAKQVSYLEIFDPYIQKWRDKEYPIFKGDVRNIKDIFEINSFDIVLWIQGPEHINKDEVKSCFEDILFVTKGLALFTCPWGIYYDAQGAVEGNIYETHLQKNLTPESFSDISYLYNIKTLGTINGGDGVIVIWHEKSSDYR